MKAVLCHAPGPLSDLRLEEVDQPAPGPGEVLLDIEACGVNFYDGLAAQGKYQTKPALPFSPGGEVAGVVKALGAGVEGLAPGMRAMAFTGFGGYAEQIAVPAENVFPIPDAMPFEVAAGFLIAYATSFHALRDRGALSDGQTVLVLGAAGGVGLAAVQIGKAMGARVIAAASTPEKLALAAESGADFGIDYSREDLRERVKEITGGRGVDVVYDPVGGDKAKAALRVLAVNGRYLVIGFAAGDIPSVAFNQLLLKQVSLVGVLWGAFARAQPRANATNIAQLLRWYGEGKLRPHIGEVFPLHRFADALDEVMQGKARGKIVIRTHAADRDAVPAEAAQ